MSDGVDVDLDVLPAELREREQWVGWRVEEGGGKATKVPVNAATGGYGSATDAITWTDVATAVDAVESGEADGIGFVFTDEDPLVGVDLDDCRDPETGAVEEDATDIIERLDSYTEVSPSGTGFHVLVEGELPEGRNRRGSVECYETARFFTVTGDHVSGTPTRIARRQDALQGIHREYVQPDDESALTDDVATAPADSAGDAAPSSEVDLGDEELVEKAMAASNGEKFERLWNGRLGGYDSQSEADMAFCCLLAFWTGGDQAQMDRLFRESGLLREKWDEVHYADGSTYGEKTIERAVQRTSEFYEPEGGETAGDVEEDGQSATSRDDRGEAYLAEKNRVLGDRVETLEARLEEKDDRIAELETMVERLKSERDAAQAELDRETESGGSESSMWGRTKNWFDSE
ncbi:primase-polymerase (primpol)-like protein [Halarchaeum solikamskense]|uniref:phage NrS-1 polymerase family protein n=1 Tax=Halarchaeum nitratireducens TaxID=489913 RepID=UPI001B3ADA47|nr:hypothetical protein [Halarchaeum solikamskense]MBP2252595.1 primase-polymerase (primpol)-like protein [Halarchaeum solikamskense]